MKLTPEIIAEILNRAQEVDQASIADGSDQKPFGVQKMEIDLSTARPESDPMPIGMPFKSIFVSDASDTIAKVFMRPNTRDSFQSAVPLKLNDSWTREKPVSKAFLHWDAQSGKTLTLFVFVDSEFRSGSQISVSGGSVSLNDGSTVDDPVREIVAPSAATKIAPVKINRKCCTLQNITGADIWIGGPGVTNSGATAGIRIADGEKWTYRNSGELYAYSVGGGSVTRLEEY